VWTHVSESVCNSGSTCEKNLENVLKCESNENDLQHKVWILKIIDESWYNLYWQCTAIAKRVTTLLIRYYWWLIIAFSTWVARNAPDITSGAGNAYLSGAPGITLCVVIYDILYVLLSFFFLPLYYLSFDLWLLISPLVSSNVY
jgi:hypothetical protein